MFGATQSEKSISSRTAEWDFLRVVRFVAGTVWSLSIVSRVGTVEIVLSAKCFLSDRTCESEWSDVGVAAS